MKTLLLSDSGYQEGLKSLTASSSLFDPEIERQTRTIVDAVRKSGDSALVDFTKKFDGADVRSHLRISDRDILAAQSARDHRLCLALAEAHHNIQEFSKASLRNIRLGK